MNDENFHRLIHERVDGTTGTVTIKFERTSRASILGSFFNTGQGRASRVEITRALDGTTDTWWLAPEPEPEST